MIIAATRYRDVEAACLFLRDVLGLTEHGVWHGDDGKIQHAQYVLGQGMLMIGPEGDGAFDVFMVSPEGAGGRETTTLYAVVEDVAAVHDRCTAFGADIVMPLEPQSYGGVSFSVRDPEGHFWTFGDYDPWA